MRESRWTSDLSRAHGRGIKAWTSAADPLGLGGSRVASPVAGGHRGQTRRGDIGKPRTDGDALQPWHDRRAPDRQSFPWPFSCRSVSALSLLPSLPPSAALWGDSDRPARLCCFGARTPAVETLTRGRHDQPPPAPQPPRRPNPSPKHRTTRQLFSSLSRVLLLSG